MTYDPRGMTVTQWTDNVGWQLLKYGPIPKLLDENKWQDWGASVLGLASLSGINLPDPYGFAEWRAWAERFNQTFDSKLYT